MSLIIIKEKNHLIPNKDYLNGCKNEYGNMISFAYAFGGKIHVNKYNNFDYFYDDLINEANKDTSLIVMFSKNQRKDNFPLEISVQQNERSFYHTENDVIFSEEDFKENFKLTSSLVGFNFNKYRNLFEMINNIKSTVILNKSGNISFFGYWFEANDVKTSAVLKQYKIEKEIIRKYNDKELMVNRCMFCFSKDGLSFINGFATVCKNCEKQLNTFKCCNCQNIYSGYFYNYCNICNNCFFKRQVSTKALYVMHHYEFIDEFTTDVRKRYLMSNFTKDETRKSAIINTNLDNKEYFETMGNKHFKKIKEKLFNYLQTPLE